MSWLPFLQQLAKSPNKISDFRIPTSELTMGGFFEWQEKCCLCLMEIK